MSEKNDCAKVTVQEITNEELVAMVARYSRLDADLRDHVQRGDLSHAEAHAEMDRREMGDPQ